VANVGLSPLIDESNWPILVVTMPTLPMSDVELRKYLDQLKKFCQRGTPYALVMDVRQAPPLAPAQRRMVAEHLDLQAEKYPNIQRGVAIVLSNSIQRGIVMVLTWLAKKPFQMQPFCSVEPALEWARKVALQPVSNVKRPAQAQSTSRGL